MIRWFNYHPVAANLLMFAIILLGIIALPDLQRETFPVLKNEKVQISIIYKGATTDEVEDAICRRIENAVESISDLDEIRCEAREGLASATAVMREEAEMMRFLDDIKSAIDSINDFPEAIEPPVIEELGRTDAVVSVAITGPENPVVLKAYAEDFKARLSAEVELANVEIKGFATHQIRIEVPALRLRQFGLSANDVANAIRSQSVGSPAGKLESSQENMILRFDDQAKDIASFESIVVLSNQSGSSIRLGDIAKISHHFEPQESRIVFNGQRAAILNITKTRSQDLLSVLDNVTAFVDTENSNAPRGLNLTLTQDRSSVVKDRLNMLVRNGSQGLFLVFLIIWLFFSFRYSFWVTMGLPVSFMGGLFVLPMVGVTINMISMVGLLIGIGLLMDDAIVIAENIATRLKKGDKPMDAAYNGIKQVLPGIASSFATTLLVFGSLAFITGEIGQILRVLPIVLIIVLTVSLLEAFLVLPHHLGHSLSHMHRREPAAFRLRFESWFTRLQNQWFGSLLEKAVHYRYLTLGIVIMLMIFAIAIPAGGKLKFVGFPKIDGDIIEARLLMPQGTPLHRTDDIIRQITEALEKTNSHFKQAQPDQQNLIKNVTVIYGENPDAYESGPHVARVVADLLGAEIRNSRIEDVTNYWRDQVGSPTDVIALKFTEPTLGPGGRAIDIRLLGVDTENVKAASRELKQWLGAFNGVTDLSDDLRPGKREYRLHFKEAASGLGLDAQTVSQQIRVAFQGTIVDEFPVGAEIYEVDLRFQASDRATLDDLEQFSVTNKNGGLIPLPVVADIEETRGWARIHRIDSQRTVTLQGDVKRDIANAQEILTLAQDSIFKAIIERYPDVHIDIQGQSKESAKTGASIVRNVLLGMIGVYILLAFQFRGYLAPLTVMSVIPTALIGVIFGHYFMGLDMTMPSIVGMASLFGVVVNDSILLVVFIREARTKGTQIHQAAIEAGIARFRPIVLTSISTIAGLLPLLLERSLQAQILIPLASSIAFGLLSATIIALFLVPSVYCILDDFGKLGEIEHRNEK
ncbi:MAG: efflux RND transporter permease subunit [Gammaproteobacteria bacterium]|nr:efflux RND transporter permease subunit [Gammaproteobacteria bacterium]